MKKTLLIVPCIVFLGFLYARAQETFVTNTEPRKVTLGDGSEITMETKYKVEVRAKENTKPLKRRMVIFAKNTTRKPFEAVLDRMRNQLTAQLAGSNIEVMDFNEVVAAIQPLMEGTREGDGVQQVGQTEKIYKMISDMYGINTGKTAGGRNATQDEKLLANTSYTRLAENMGADYVLLLTLDRFSKDTKTFTNKNLNGPIVNEIYKITATYKILDAYVGTAIGGGTLRAQKSVRQTSGVKIEFEDYADGLEEELIAQVKEEILAREGEWRVAALEASGIKVEFNAVAFDMNNKPIYLPHYDGKNQVLNDRVPATLAAMIEVDGVAKGTASCTIPLSPGMHKVRFTRSGYEDVVMTITPREGLVLSVSLRMTEGEYNRVKDLIEFMHRLTMEREISQSTVKVYEGKAKMLEQSGIRIDAKKLPETQIMRSVF